MPASRHFWLGGKGFVVSVAQALQPQRTVRHPAVILLTACGRPFRLRGPGCDLITSAAVVAPQCARSLQTDGVLLLSFHVQPHHPAFSAFAGLATPIQALRREAFAAADTAMLQMTEGRSDTAAASALFEFVVEQACAEIGQRAGVRDDRIEEALALLDHDMSLPLPALADGIGLSDDRLSHLFTEQVGLSVRSYRAWRRAAKAWEMFAFDASPSLTETAHACGFSDSAHLSRCWQHYYAMSPSRTRDSRYLQVLR
jgi:AraC-like DNA-binding protein